ncbi:MAG: hypothetical protein M1821_004464 [Bathelium mastoideum]|nr:MAG: hypothetical protein M1821_004464 [Bathelium mastoideum]
MDSVIDRPPTPSSLQDVPRSWDERSSEDGDMVSQGVHPGYTEARSLIRDGSPDVISELSLEALRVVNQIFTSLSATRTSHENSGDKRGSGPGITSLRLSPSLQQWRSDQFAAGRILPAKGHGLTRGSPKVIHLLGAEDWPQPLLTNNALFGSVMANLLIGAHDGETLYSNFCTDMAFYYEHGYHKVFPELGDVLRDAIRDEHALMTPGGKERRTAVESGLRYIRGKIALEEEHKGSVENKIASLDRRTAQTVFLQESSLMGMAAETVVRGFDPGAAMSDLVFSSPGTDVIDVGSDLANSEVLNAFLNTADVTESGIVSEEVLRRVYNAYAYTGARMFTERWSEPLARMCATLYTWHIQNDRHMFLRRAILGWEKAKKGGLAKEQEQREADFDEVFDEGFHTTGFSRPLKNACNGGDPCDHVERLISLTLEEGGKEKQELLAHLWWYLSTGPIAYVERGVISKEREDELGEGLRIAMASCYEKGWIDEMAWLLAHAGQHAWQINRVFEAAMFGSLLDDGGLKGKLDRIDR